MPKLRSTLLVVGASLFALVLVAQQEPSENGKPRDRIDLQVRLVSENDRPIGMNLRVELLSEDSAGTQLETLTNGQGVADIILYRQGNFRLRVSGPGVETTMSDSFSILSGGGTILQYVKVKVLHPEQTGSAASGSASAASYTVPKEASKEFDKGVAALRKREWKEAQTHFEAAIAHYPKFDLAYDDLGIAKQNNGDLPGAKAAYQKAIELNDHGADALRNLARVLEGERNWAAAADLLTKSLGIEPNSAGSLTLLSIAQIEQGNVDLAIATASRVHALEHKSYAMAHLVLARAYELKSRTADAIAEYQMYLKEDPSGPKAAAAKENLAKLTLPPK